MPPLPLDIPPGIVKVDSPNGATGRYTDSDKIRFVKGRPEKWSGWEQLIDDTMQGIARSAISWVNASGNINAAFGTHLKLYSLLGTDTLGDITPIRASSTINNNPFATTNASTTVTVTDTAHGCDDGDFVTFSGATAVGGITIVGEYQITLLTANTYTITHSSAATSTVAAGGGASVVAAYQISIGFASGVSGLGWGAGTWGAGTWGTPRTSGIPLQLRVWSLAEYGNDLLASPSRGTLYLWEEATDDNAEAVTNAPSSILAMFVTPERFVIALGTTTPMTLAWPDQDDITDWTPSASNTANTRTLQSGSELMGGSALSDGVSLIWSDASLYLMQYTGSDFVYDTRLIGTNCGLFTRRGFAVGQGIAFWISNRSFKMYAGGVQDIPNSIDVSDFVFDNMNQTHVDKTWCFYDEVNNQIRWHYCSGVATEPDRYVDVSIGDWTWTVGTLDRTTATSYRSGELLSLGVDSGGAIYLHDVGTDADGAAMESYVTFGLYALARGEQLVDVMGVIPDCQRQTGNLDFALYTKERPNSASSFDTQTVTMGATDAIGDARVSGRHFGMTVRSNAIAGDFRLGVVNLEVQGGGTRR